MICPSSSTRSVLLLRTIRGEREGGSSAKLVAEYQGVGPFRRANWRTPATGDSQRRNQPVLSITYGARETPRRGVYQARATM